MTLHALRGPAATFIGDPFEQGSAALHFESDALIVIKDGKVRAFGDYAKLRPKQPADLAITHYRDGLVLPGFIDLHAHYAQIGIIGSYGRQLIDWLDHYAFPAEEAFADPAHARLSAEVFLDECLRCGTTTSLVYGTVHPQSVDAFFEVAAEKKLRMIAGKVMMDRNAPESLTDTAKSSYDDSKKLIKKWHGKGRLEYAVTPRFAITSTPEQLEAAAALRKEHPGVLMQTHIAENHDEIRAVRELFPDHKDYFGVYQDFDLAGPRAVFGHGVHLAKREWQALHESGSALAHCPTSNGFLGSGLFRMADARKAGRAVKTGIGTDVGGGTSLSLLRTLGHAYQIGQLAGHALTAAEAFYLITRGAAEALGLEKHIGSIAPGMDADLTVLDLASTPLIAHRMRTCQGLEDVLFAQMTMADDRATKAVYVAGELAYTRRARARRAGVRFGAKERRGAR